MAEHIEFEHGGYKYRIHRMPGMIRYWFDGKLVWEAPEPIRPSLARIDRDRQPNPWEIRLAALRYAQRERLKLEIKAFLWSIPLAVLMVGASVVLIRWLA